MAVGVSAKEKENEEIVGLASQLGTAAWMARYSRDDELEADYYGMDYMAQSGYEPEGAVELQESFVSFSKDKATSFLSGLFASHPPSMRRVEANRIKAKTLPSGDRGRTRFQAAIRQLKKDELAYEAAEKAKKALKKNDPRGALSSLNKAVDIQPDEFSFWVLRGKAWKMLGETGRAERAFTTSISKNPNHYSAYLERGVLLYDSGDKIKGIADIKRSQALLPTAEGNYYLGNAAMEQKNYQRAKAYFEVGAKSSENVGSRSRAKLANLNGMIGPNKEP
jgi:predicted Zn-dependent protease